MSKILGLQKLASAEQPVTAVSTSSINCKMLEPLESTCSLNC